MKFKEAWIILYEGKDKELAPALILLDGRSYASVAMFYGEDVARTEMARMSSAYGGVVKFSVKKVEINEIVEKKKKK